ncbi:hypothetical protein Nocox_36355 [Nonomuraea coxensis DSM 45129]|uniref:SH3b domain-containing protein n=1 Tax=Nonomuraea coxensis DSM 45129 TaxID=1122611 RepID=A0ABX8UBE8_9ACTN|nr:hypothetical protein [Nonomuraea coxensis]QYC44825.1 hypothetical protein Nocox_36355 [Nonomuraea coxensis DSM 45129]
MVTHRVAAILAAAALTGSALVAAAATPASAVAVLELPGCRYRIKHVKTWLNVRAAPRGRIIDRLYPGDVTWGSCRTFDGWRRIHGTEIGRRGFSFARHLKKIGRR